jgi:hypothetical protein
MRNVVKIITLALFLLVIPIAAHADFTIRLRNTTDRIMIYRVYWIDHGWENWPGPANIIGAEIRPGESFSSGGAYGLGSYFYDWKEAGSDKEPYIGEFQVNSLNIREVIVDGPKVTFSRNT